MKALDLMIHCYFIQCIIFLNYLFARSKKLISKICKAFDVIENLVWTKQEIFACFVFPSLVNKYLWYKIKSIVLVVTNVLMCIIYVCMSLIAPGSCSKHAEQHVRHACMLAYRITIYTSNESS